MRRWRVVFHTGVFVRRSWSRLVLGLCVALAGLVFGVGVLAATETPIALQAGEVRVLGIPGVARVAVGDGEIIKAVSTDDREVILFARKAGFSTLHAWTADGQIVRYAVQVAPEGARQLQDELRTVLERIPGALVTPLGDKLLVEGDDLSDADRQRLSELGRRYPQLLDFTGTVGWDQMVLLDVQVIEVPKSLMRELGLRWDPNAGGGLTSALGWDGGVAPVCRSPWRDGDSAGVSRDKSSRLLRYQCLAIGQNQPPCPGRACSGSGATATSCSQWCHRRVSGWRRSALQHGRPQRQYADRFQALRCVLAHHPLHRA